MSATLCRLYHDLSWLWPLWGSVEEYRVESEAIAGLARRTTLVEPRTLLDVACGGGKNLHHFRRHFEAEGLDASQPMLANARSINPDCVLHHGDMRSFDLGRRYDVVYLNDGLPHLHSPAELGQSFARAYDHLNPGGVVVAVAEFTPERFSQNRSEVTAAASGAAPPGVEVVFVENHYDPDPDDETFEATHLYLIREHGRLRVEQETWELGLFPLDVWQRLLAEAGFEVHLEESLEAVDLLPVLVGVRPL